jgi:hypothetical protein
MVNFCFCLIFYNYSSLSESKVLADHGVIVTGKVKEVTCENHASFVYEFEKNDLTFEGTDYSFKTGIGCDSLKIGTLVSVVFLPENPRVSSIGEPKQNLRDNLMFVFMMVFFLAMTTLFLFFRPLSWLNNKIDSRNP